MKCLNYAHLWIFIKKIRFVWDCNHWLFRLKVWNYEMRVFVCEIFLMYMSWWGRMRPVYGHFCCIIYCTARMALWHGCMRACIGWLYMWSVWMTWRVKGHVYEEMNTMAGEGPWVWGMINLNWACIYIALECAWLHEVRARDEPEHIHDIEWIDLNWFYWLFVCLLSSFELTPSFYRHF